MTDWPAPVRSRPLGADVTIPGSKSLTNRVLVLAALGEDESRVERPLVSRDTDLMAAALESLGAQIERQAQQWTIRPIEFGDAPVEIDCGLAGTVMRFVPPIAALGHAPVTFDGDPRARERPMTGTIAGVRALGAEVDDQDRASLPFTVRPQPDARGGEIAIDASASSQFVSALLLVGARFPDGLRIRHIGDALPSQPHIEMTITQLRERGVRVDAGTSSWTVHPGPIAARDVTIEPDLSNAGPFVAAALVTGGRVRVHQWPEDTDQAGDAWRWIVPAFGGSVHRDDDALVFSSDTALTGVDLDLHDVGELTPVVAALAALADGPSTLRGIAHLRGHETDRLAALATEINALGGEVTETADGLRIVPRRLHAGVFGTYHDHRMAHAAAVLGLAVPGLVVADIETTAKTYPDFPADWTELCR
ncbi:3-phosphoshikimate 1-carboxyvinyltransferase [Aeromicrobium sp. YIM 150415]|uniref:3-phosphoshikimate 1-carboxyvinyltransferase n=1 Tax=Aeromicrobium sp. YIM 150415 TaxID=2803912 RepID=UPI001965481D|nr:3-phosphoshikimate 1-carboxyvinyltransferase [Aeromicrobium sp. YIM 150415]MBM9462992.1 3-phosphoshikimate 1-carboxyvinyltransferase [Aeromicrobium sp. YIM 150415]